MLRDGLNQMVAGQCRTPYLTPTRSAHTEALPIRLCKLQRTAPTLKSYPQTGLLRQPEKPKIPIPSPSLATRGGDSSPAPHLYNTPVCTCRLVRQSMRYTWQQTGRAEEVWTLAVDNGPVRLLLCSLATSAPSIRSEGCRRLEVVCRYSSGRLVDLQLSAQLAAPLGPACVLVQLAGKVSPKFQQHRAADP